MTINGWEISEAGAKQASVVWGYSGITPKSVWTPGSPIPVLLAPQPGFKPLQVILAVEGNGRDAIRNNISLILSKLMTEVEIVLDRIEHTFHGTLKSYTAEESSRKRWHKLTLNLEGYETGTEVTVSGTGSVTMLNPGTAETPLVITLTPTAGISAVTVSIPGAGWTASFANLGSGTPVEINGETGLITENGVLKEAEITKLPAIMPGTSVLGCSSQMVNMSVTFRPRYL